jgi:predicted RNase H-like HicB family nuclease
VFLKPAEEGGFVAYNPETGTTSEGEIVAEAFSNSQESTILYIKEFPLVSHGHPLATMFTVPAHT